MKFLCFSDLHRDQQTATKLVDAARHVDVVIGAGDFTNQHHGISDTINILSAISTSTVLVPGNGETVVVLNAGPRGVILDIDIEMNAGT